MKRPQKRISGPTFDLSTPEIGHPTRSNHGSDANFHPIPIFTTFNSFQNIQKCQFWLKSSTFDAIQRCQFHPTIENFNESNFVPTTVIIFMTICGNAADQFCWRGQTFQWGNIQGKFASTVHRWTFSEGVAAGSTGTPAVSRAWFVTNA